MTLLAQSSSFAGHGWLKPEELDAQAVGRRLYGWLLWERPLIEQVQAASGLPVTIDDRSETIRPSSSADCALMGTAPGSVWQRTTTVAVGGLACVYATALAPAELLEAHAFLRELGDAPLGATLAEHAEFRREGLRYRRCESAPTDWERVSELVLAPGRIHLHERFTREFERWPAP